MCSNKGFALGKVEDTRVSVSIVEAADSKPPASQEEIMRHIWLQLSKLGWRKYMKALGTPVNKMLCPYGGVVDYVTK